MKSAFIFTAEGHLNTKLQRQQDLYQTKYHSAPTSYKTNTTKEELCLEYINSFIDQFLNIYKKRNIPFMVAENEFGIKKFVCSTLRPTLIPIPEIYDLYECAAFLAGYTLYEPLDPPHEPPKYLFSPLSVLEQNTGDCFDLSNLLCSFLLGGGYDAYVVYGYAPDYISLKDQSFTQCPMIMDTSETVKVKTPVPTNTASSAYASESTNTNNASANATSNATGNTNAEGAGGSGSYIPPDNSVKNSKFLAELAEKKRLAAIDTFQLWIQDPPLDETKMMEEARNRSGKESRVHAWVLVRAGRREIKEHIFIESSTGRVYTVKNSPYLAIEAIWNHINFWINTKFESKVHELDYNFPVNKEGWEALFLDKNKTTSKTGQEEENNENDLMNETSRSETEGKTITKEENIRYFDAPTRWSLPLNITRQQYLLQFPPSGKRTIKYYCSKVDFYAKGMHSQAMVMRITNYLDAACTIVKEIHEWFENRVDHMYKRIRYYLDYQRRFVEYYSPGSRGDVKKWTEYPGKRIEIDYYVNGRLDRLARREEVIGESITEYFEGRTDLMTFRSVILSADRGSLNGRQFILPSMNELSTDLHIIRMTQHFEKNPEITAKEENLPIGFAPNSIEKKLSLLQQGNSFSSGAGGGGGGAGAAGSSLLAGGGGANSSNANANNTNFTGENIAKRIFYVREGKAVFYYHFGKSQITGKIRTFLHTRGPSIPVLSEQAISQEIGLDDDQDALQEAAALERECFSSIKSSYQQHDKLVEIRLEGEIRVESEKTVFDKALDSVDTKLGSTQNLRDASYSSESKGTDYLTPFLKNISDPTQLTREDALAIRQACLDALKARLVERANIIQSKLHEENAQLGKKQESFQRQQRDGDFSTEEYEKYCTEAMFRIQILEQRLAAHEDAALRKFAELDLKLSNDPRLKVLKN